MYRKTLYAGWRDMDFNSHMRNTAYLDKAADVRQMFLIEHGFPVEEFARRRIGPRRSVARRDAPGGFPAPGGFLRLVGRSPATPRPAGTA